LGGRAELPHTASATRHLPRPPAHSSAPPLPPQRLSLATVPAAWLLNSSGCAGALLRLAAVCGGMVRCPDPRPAPLAALLPPLLPRPQVLAHALLRARSLSSRWRYLHEQFKGQG
jgi:hypothetical protein